MTLTRPPAAAADSLAVVPLPPNAFDRLVRLHRAAFPPEQVAGTIYAGAGVARYLASLTAYPALQGEHAFWGARRGRALIGYAHCRALPDAWHLNNIAVLPDCQGQGVGSRLWQQYVESGRARGFGQLSLDVEADNAPAIAWYSRQGLALQGATWRYEKPLPAAGPDLPAGLRLAGWEQAEAWQAAYGFSQFQIAAGDQVWTIGRLGERYFRAGGPLPAAVEAALAGLDPTRRLLVFSAEPLDDPAYTLLGRSLRMRGALH